MLPHHFLPEHRSPQQEYRDQGRLYEWIDYCLFSLTSTSLKSSLSVFGVNNLAVYLFHMAGNYIAGLTGGIKWLYLKGVPWIYL